MYGGIVSISAVAEELNSLSYNGGLSRLWLARFFQLRTGDLTSAEKKRIPAATDVCDGNALVELKS
jgi:hypothetical protein